MMRKFAAVAVLGVLAGLGVGVFPGAVASAASCRQAVRVVVSPVRVLGGAKATGTVLLRCRLGSHGHSVTLRTWRKGLSAPTSIWVKAHAATASFAISTPVVSSTTSVLVQATLGSVKGTGRLTLLPLRLTSFTLSSQQIQSGGSADVATVRLSAAAPAGGLAIDLASDSTVIQMPKSVRVSAGHTSVQFSVSALQEWSTAELGVTLSAAVTQTGQRITTHATVLAAPTIVSSLQILGPITYIAPGHSLSGQVALGYPATTPTVVTLTSDNPNLVVPTSVTVPAGSPSAAFPITALAQNTTATVTLTASYQDSRATTTVSLLPGDIQTLVGTAPIRANVPMYPGGYLPNGETVQGKITLYYAEPTDTVISLSNITKGSDLTLPETVTVPAGQTSATFPITSTGTLTKEAEFRIQASLGTQTVKAWVVTGPMGLAWIDSTYTSFPISHGGMPYIFVTLWASVTTPTVVTLTSSDPRITVPATMTIPAGRDQDKFAPALNGTVSEPIQVTITATANGQTVSYVQNFTP